MIKLNLKEYNQLVFDFDGVFTNNKVTIDQNGIEYIVVSRADGYAIELLKKAKKRGLHNLDFYVLSTESNSVVELRCKKMKIKCFSGIPDKLEFLESQVASKGADISESLQRTIYVGNDLNDLSIMRKVGLSIAPADAHPAILEICDIKGVQKGGQDFVREIIELMLGLDNMSLEELHEFVSDS